jgi:tRNA (guanine26-N2/guanine27-N2)-dimethyltransferase
MASQTHMSARIVHMYSLISSRIVLTYAIHLLAISVEFEGAKYSAIKENQSSILFKNANEVFYNPVQEVNRDISVAVLKAFVSRLSAEHAGKHSARVERLAAAAENVLAKAIAEKSASTKTSTTASTAAAPTHSSTPTDAMPPLPKLRVLEALSATGMLQSAT